MAKPSLQETGGLMLDQCCGSLYAILKGTGDLAGSLKQNSNVSLLSAEGRVLSAILRNDDLIMKDIPHLTGISFRSCFDCIRKLSELGIVEKARGSNDKRSVVIRLNRKKLCEMVCPAGSMPQSAAVY